MPQIRHNNLPSHNAYHGLLAKLVLQYWSQENDGKTGCAVHHGLFVVSSDSFIGLKRNTIFLSVEGNLDGDTDMQQDAYDIDEVEGQRVLDFNGIQFGVSAGAKVVFGWLPSRQQHEGVS